jgi:hypothetical protein
MKKIIFSEEGILKLLSYLSGKSDDERNVFLKELFRERIPEGVFVVYGNSDDTREFSNSILDRKDITGIAIKVETLAGSYWLVRALKHERSADFLSAMSKALQAKVAGGQASLGEPGEWLAMYDKREDVNEVASLLGSEIADEFRDVSYWMHRPNGCVIHMQRGIFSHAEAYSEKFLMLFSAFPC